MALARRSTPAPPRERGRVRDDPVPVRLGRVPGSVRRFPEARDRLDELARLRENLEAARLAAHRAARAVESAEGEVERLRAERARSGVDLHAAHPAVEAAAEARQEAEEAEVRVRALEDATRDAEDDLDALVTKRAKGWADDLERERARLVAKALEALAAAGQAVARVSETDGLLVLLRAWPDVGADAQPGQFRADRPTPLRDPAGHAISVGAALSALRAVVETVPTPRPSASARRERFAEAVRETVGTTPSYLGKRLPREE